MDTNGTSYIVGNEFYFFADPSQEQEPIAVRQGTQISRLTPLTTENVPCWLFDTHTKLDILESVNSAALRESWTALVDFGINALPDWSLTGGQTLHVELSPPRLSGTSTINLVEGFPVHADRDGDWLLTALIACHRAEAELEVSWNQGSERQSHKIPFNPTCHGGPSRSGYQAIEQKLPLKGGINHINLGFKHHAYKPDQSSHPNSFLFIANPCLVEGGRKQQTNDAKPMPWQKGNPQPILNKNKAFRAVITPFSSPSDDPISLQWDDGSTEVVFQPFDTSITLAENYGHSLVVEASSAGSYALYINGTLAAHQHLAAGLNTISIPSKWLRGEPILVQVRDSSGSQIFLSSPILAPRHLTPVDLLLKETRRPFPTDLTCRANHRYQALRAHLKQPVPGITQASLLQALETLDCDYNTLKLKPLSFPEIQEPEVSVVMPAHNKVEATYYALSALLLAHNKTRFEVILVDDGSTDATAEIEKIVSGIQVIHNAQPLRFIKACNRGVGMARGHYIVLLNNDTEVTVGWLDALIDGFQRFPRVGAVGSKLLYPDGTLQDAGGIVWGSGNPWNYGNKQNPWDPRFSYSRQVDYLSGAALMTTKAIWDEVGGLSGYLEPMYFDDTDFSFKVREAGYQTYFVPSSVVYHFEGTTSGTDTRSGFKKYQEVNRPKFKRRWAKAFSRHGEEGVAPDLEKDRGIAGRFLFIDYTTPREDADAGSYAAIREIELVQSLGYKVTFLPQNLGYFGNYTEELQRMGVEVIVAPFFTSVAYFLAKRAKEFDAAYITRYYVAADTVHHIREHSPKTRIILNNADLHFLRELRAALSENDAERMRAMRGIREQELDMMRKADLVLSYNDVEHAVISSHTDGAVKVMTCPWVVELPDMVAPLETRKGLSFLGSFRHHPNVEGMLWFCKEVMPQLQNTQIALSIYGSGMDEEIRELANAWIHPVGYIEDMADPYQQHRVFVAPLLSGAGIKGKVLNALAYGIPTVLTPTAAEGIGLRHGHDCLIAKTADEWVAAITRLHDNNELWQSISQAARAYAASQFSFEAGRQKMKAALEAVDLFSHIDD